jgi:hypothetical protein
VLLLHFLFIYIQPYWNASEHIAVANEKDIDNAFVLVSHSCISI